MNQNSCFVQEIQNLLIRHRTNQLYICVISEQFPQFRLEGSFADYADTNMSWNLSQHIQLFALYQFTDCDQVEITSSSNRHCAGVKMKPVEIFRQNCVIACLVCKICTK